MDIDMTKDISGLKKLYKNPRDTSGDNKLTLEELFGKDFVDKLVSHFEIKNDEELYEIPEKEIDIFVAKHTQFETYWDLNTEKTIEFLKKKLDL